MRRRWAALAVLGATALGWAASSRADEGAAPLEARLARTMTPPQRAEWAFLEHLGWRLEPAPGAARIVLHPGMPCRRADLAEARAAGDLVVRVPTPVDERGAATFAALLPHLVDSLGSRCAHKLQLVPAVRRATERLSEAAQADRFVFPKILFWHQFWFEFSPPESEWTEAEGLHRPRATPSAAIRAVYEEDGASECYSAQQVAVYAVQYELYGDRFDAAFRAEELCVGRPPDMLRGPLGDSLRSDRTHPWYALVLPREAFGSEETSVLIARLGHQAFVGLTGILRDQDGGIGANQNLMIVSVSPRAAERLRAHGGIPWVNARLREVYEHWSEATEMFASSSTIANAVARCDALLADPVFTEILVYVHPYGVQPLRDLAWNEMKEDDVPVGVMLYVHGREDALYRRYRDAFVAAWLARHHGGATEEPCGVAPRAPR
jgi:hypothetical protein